MQTAARKFTALRSIAGRDASEVLQAAEHALDGVAVAIEEWREAVLPLPICLWRDVWHRATPLDLLRFNGGTVDQHLRRRPTSLSQCAKQIDPHALRGPAHVWIIECLPT